MKNSLLFLLLGLCLASPLLAQQSSPLPGRAVLRFQPHQLNKAQLFLGTGEVVRKASCLADLPSLAEGPFIAYSVVWYARSWDEEKDQLLLFFQENDARQGPIRLHADGHAEPADGQHISQLYFLEGHADKLRLQFNGQADLDSIVVHLYSPGHTGSLPPPTVNEAPHHFRAACTCPQPAYEGRLDWCPDGSCPPDASPVAVANVTHLIVHHSAGVNTANDWAAVVRSIWDFHVNVNGWDDVGYNWLVDPNGVLYEGRGDGILGAHFCGQNGNTMGVCVMGDFTSQTPLPAALGKLEELLTWKCCDADLNPLGNGPHASSGLLLDRISGHRDGCSTSCPGDSFYPLLPGVRNAVQGRIDNGCQPSLLQAPTVLAVTYVLNNQVGLQWQDNAATEDGFALERSDNDNAGFAQLALLPANSTSYDDPTVLPGITYFYRVKAVGGAASSAYSNEAVVVTGVAGTSDGLGPHSVSIFPNPTHGTASVVLDLAGSGTVDCAVFDAAGRQVLSMGSLEKRDELLRFELDLSGLPSGVFLVKINMGTQLGWFRLAKARG